MNQSNVIMSEKEKIGRLQIIMRRSGRVSRKSCSMKSSSKLEIVKIWLLEHPMGNLQ